MSPTTSRDYAPLLIAILLSSLLVLLDLVGFLGWYKNLRSYISYPITTLSHNATVTVLLTADSVLRGSTLKRENLALRQKVLELESMVNSYSEQIGKNEALEKLYQQTKGSNYKTTVNAEILDLHALQLSGKLFLNKGATSGIKVGMPVVISTFYLGYISEVTSFESTCVTYEIPGQEFIGFVQSKKLTGIIRVGINGMELGDLLATEKVSLHDVVTMKREEYPYFFTLGTVEKIPSNNGSAERRAVVESPLILSELTYVTVIKE